MVLENDLIERAKKDLCYLCTSKTNNCALGCIMLKYIPVLLSLMCKEISEVQPPEKWNEVYKRAFELSRQVFIKHFEAGGKEED